LTFGIDLQDVVHARERQNNSALSGKRAAGEPSARATAHDRDIKAIRQFDNLDYVLLAARKDNGIGTRLFDRTVVLVQQ